MTQNDMGGMTYREWLIGQTLAGLGRLSSMDAARYACSVADDVVKLLDQEANQQ